MTRIVLQVTDAHGGRIAEASVYFLTGPVPLPDVAQLTNDDGEVRLAAPVPGTYRIGVRAGGFEPGEAVVEVQGDAEVAVGVALTPSP